jgi:putative ABC transport system permease protein
MSFGNPQVVQVDVSPSAVRAGLFVIGFSLIAQVLPTVGAARHTMVSYRQEQARMVRPPWWQRTGLDMLLLIPAAYGTYVLHQQGTLALPTMEAAQNDPFQNPLLVLVPTIAILAMTLLLVRLLPLFVRLFAWIAKYTRSVSFLMAVRHLARAPGFYAAPMVLLITTLSLAAFFSATAATLDQHLEDQMWYQAGAEAVVHPALDFGDEGEGESSTSSASEEARLPDWYSVPVEDYVAVPGVVQIARVAQYRSWLPQTPSLERGSVMALDRYGFADVAFWREDFAQDSLGTLMNQLGQTPNGVLMPKDVMERYLLNRGDTVRLTVETFGKQTELSLRIVGSFELFPTWNPNYGPLFVINLGYLHGRLGLELPTSVWIRTAPGKDKEATRADLLQVNPFSSVSFPYQGGIAAEYDRPERQGVLGILSIGFLATALLATAGFLLYSLFSFQRRALELGTLRAMGISFWGLSRYLAWELIFLITVGLGGGTGLGVVVSYLWIPYFRVGSKIFAEVLPMNVTFSVPSLLSIYAVFTLMMVFVLVLSVVLARRVKLFEAVKMLEAL